MEYGNRGYITVTDFVPADGVTDVADMLQKLIDENPNRTLFFPDGVYCMGKPIRTPAHPERSVDLQLSNFACLRAAENWAGGAMVRLGGKDPANTITVPGSNYGMAGGVLDCGGVADGVAIEGGRESYVRHTNIKNARIGLHIAPGANNNSSDADIMGVNITGNGTRESVGVLIEGYDNTLTNMRIANVFIGVKITSGGNMLRNIHPLYYRQPGLAGCCAESTGFALENPMNWLDYCYSDQFAVGFRTGGGGILKNCFCWWYSGEDSPHVAVRSEGPFFGSVDTFVIGGQEYPGCPNRFMDEGACVTGPVRNVVRVLPDDSREVLVP